jgi:phosphatidylinositol-bisphosphatase
MRLAGKFAHEFQEGEIHFPPTYRYDVNTNRFDSSKKKRIPSYTDRVLYKMRDPSFATEVNYDSIGNTHSDHRPVFA